MEVPFTCGDGFFAGAVGLLRSSLFDCLCDDLLRDLPLRIECDFLYCRARGDIRDCSCDGRHAVGGAANCGGDVACHLTSRAGNFASRFYCGGREIYRRFDDRTA